MSNADLGAWSLVYDSAKLKVEGRRSVSEAELRVTGVIDEDINFSFVLAWLSEAVEAAKRDNAVPITVGFDLTQITAMNSCGVREWLLFMERMPKACHVRITNANELIVEQANMITNIFGPVGTLVLRFQAPYHCEHCKRGEVATLEPSQVQFQGTTPIVPEARCSQCKRVMEFDSIAEEYFGFVRRDRERAEHTRKRGGQVA